MGINAVEVERREDYEIGEGIYIKVFYHQAT